MDDSFDFKVDINNFSGSLEVLLDLAKSQKVDLETISITKLANESSQSEIRCATGAARQQPTINNQQPTNQQQQQQEAKS